jgi:CDP-diacylglycerol--glycerol-3-phosphate 3-phosphatidyltransferase
MMLTTVLIFLEPLAFASIVVLFLACATDMVDGPLARNLEGAATELGAILDSIADLYLVIVGVFVLVPAMEIWEGYWWIIIGVLSFKLCSAIPALIKHRQLFYLHSLGNKFQGLLLVSIAVFYLIFGGGQGMDIFVAVALALISLIVIEEMLIISLLDYPDKNIRGIWEVRRANREYREKKNQQM